MTSFILNEFSCSKKQVPCVRKQQTKIEAYIMRSYFLNNFEQSVSVFARGCVEKYSVHEKIF